MDLQEKLQLTGLDLSEGDKIRNFILMGLPTSLQDSYYENYWNRIEECTKYDVSSYIRDYLSVKQQSIPSQKRIYANFKEYVELVGVQTEDLLKELLAYARRYQILLNGGTHSKKLDACIYRLNRLETTVTRPFFLEVLRLLDEEKLDIAQVADIFLTTENYLFRRTICDLPTNALNKIFLMLHREVVRYDGTENDYVANNGGSVTFYNNDKTEKFVVDSKKIRRIYTVCVTVDNFNVFEAKIEKTNFFNSASGTIAISIDDLDVYEDYFDSEICFLHFLKHRKAATRIRNLTLNDELDHLGLYISQNSYEEYVNDFRDCNSFMANGFREELDAYYAGVHNSLIAKDKPTQVIPQYYREIFGYLEKNDIDGRTEFGEFILDFAYDERERLDESIRGRILREKQLGYMTPMWVEFDLFSYCCFVNIPDIESLSERHRKKYVYANMIDRKQNLCWYIFVDLDRNGHVNSIIARKVLSSQYVSDGFTTDEIHKYISEMKSRRKAHGTNMPSVHKRKVYPNELCPCGSGMKYKKCCGKNK